MSQSSIASRSTANLSGLTPNGSSNSLDDKLPASFAPADRNKLRSVLELALKELHVSHAHVSSTDTQILKSELAEAARSIDNRTGTINMHQLQDLLLRGANMLSTSDKLNYDILHHLVFVPIKAFTIKSIQSGIEAWTTLLKNRPGTTVALLSEVTTAWAWTIRERKGFFNTSLNASDPFVHPVEYSPSDHATMDAALSTAKHTFTPHLLLIQFFSEFHQSISAPEPAFTHALVRTVLKSCSAVDQMSTHSIARPVRFHLMLFGLQLLRVSKLEAVLEIKLRDEVYKLAFAWFKVRPQWSYATADEIKVLQDVVSGLASDSIQAAQFISSARKEDKSDILPGGQTVSDYRTLHAEKLKLLNLLIDNEIGRLSVWSNPMSDAARTHRSTLEKSIRTWPHLVKTAWGISPAVAVHMAERFKNPIVITEVSALIRSRPKEAIDVPEALHFLLGNRLERTTRKGLQWLPLWSPVPPVTAVTYFLPQYNSNPLLLQYAMRVLEQHPVQLTFFFVPQVVQALRTDALGYVERFIFETSKVSQLFCHQIIWNMKANCFKDDSATEPDPMKPMLDRMVDKVVQSLSGEAQAFYDREFRFFNNVTDISGKLKPFIKCTKPEKKVKIDEEMAKIVVDKGVYLPSNPDGVVVDIDKKSGRPLQSHAKTPFMATFKVRREKVMLDTDAEDSLAPSSITNQKTFEEVWQAAIFKVGDDCRQDVLALQIIAMFKNIFAGIGLPVYLFPYRVTATAPGCGVIDVVPDSTSRDEMGRNIVNDLPSFFVSKYGKAETPEFQKAQRNFIESMAAYSVACYILQIKDRHNGNIMIDGEGHIVHIDFGFLFDIDEFKSRFIIYSDFFKLTCAFWTTFVGVKFEPNSFKLTREMIAVMGGDSSKGYRLFQELTVKAFLAIRPHAGQLVDTVRLMLETALPSFKGEGTIRRLKDRFCLDLNEKHAAEYMFKG
ncbi:phosphatidylinositol 4-kinase [Phaffia rhodozyma]|uniref:1-phosphatidylinositol 4-kinase n=1 Tax=Phaffia rhodozyma TaxID=264483 RepID=A0A0F7SEV0_PHARH|nr:phosphatidylinositol 4-kinase [Phaffia rhodozyma]